MGLSQFGGRSPAAGTGSSGGSGGAPREIGELAQVPLNFSHPSYVDVGTTVTALSHPELFKTLTDSSIPTEFKNVTVNMPTITPQPREDFSGLFTAIQIDNEVIQIHANGIVTSTTDCNVSSYRGELPAIDGISPSLWLNAPTARRSLAFKNGRLLFVSGTFNDYIGSWYSDDLGRTWSPTSVPSIEQISTAGDAFTWQAGLFHNSTHFFIYDWKLKLLHRSEDGITWTNTKGPTVALALGSTWANPAGTEIVLTSTTDKRFYYSANNGETWTSTVMPSVTLVTYSNITTFNGAVYTLGHGASNAVYVYRSMDNGLSWATAATVTITLAPNLLAVAGGKLWILPVMNASTPGQPPVSSSPNGTTWTNGTSTGPGTSTGAWSVVRHVYPFFDMLVMYYTSAKRPTYSTALSAGISFSAISAATTSCVLQDPVGVGFTLATPTHMFLFSSGPHNQYMVSTDGIQWDVGQLPEVVSIEGVYFDPIQNTIYVCLSNKEPFISNDNGQTWKSMSRLAGTSSIRGVYPIQDGRAIALSQATTKPLVLGAAVDGNGQRLAVPIPNAATGYKISSNSAVPAGKSGLVCLGTTTNTLNAWNDINGSLIAITLTFAPLALSNVGEKIIAIGQSMAAVCTNTNAVTTAANWREISLPAVNQWTDVHVYDGRVVALARGSNVGVVGDGYSWTRFEINSPFTEFSSCVFQSMLYLVDTSTRALAVASPATTRLIPDVASPVPGTKMVVKAK